MEKNSRETQRGSSPRDPTPRIGKKGTCGSRGSGGFQWRYILKSEEREQDPGTAHIHTKKKNTCQVETIPMEGGYQPGTGGWKEKKIFGEDSDSRKIKLRGAKEKKQRTEGKGG